MKKTARYAVSGEFDATRLETATKPAPVVADMLLAQAEAIDQLPVLVSVGPLQVVEELAPPAHHTQQTAPGMVILYVGLEVLREVRDTRRQQRDLDLGRSCIAVRALILFDEVGFLCVGY